MFKDKKILVTGGTGSIGSEITRQLLAKDCVVRVFSNDENSLYEMQNNLVSERIQYMFGDIRDRKRVMEACQGVDIVYHCAALKHVPLCEENPVEAVKTNVLGTLNLVQAAAMNKVSQMVNISTDKAVYPEGTMGATKLLTEKITVDANRHSDFTRYASVRFGNVIGSRGSVIPYWEKCISEGKPVPVTDPDMTRYMMQLDQAVGLVLRATMLMQGGEVFILKMPKVRLGDLVNTVIAGRDVRMAMVGVRPGERMHEFLFTEQERDMLEEIDDMYILRRCI